LLVLEGVTEGEGEGVSDRVGEGEGEGEGAAPTPLGSAATPGHVPHSAAPALSA